MSSRQQEIGDEGERLAAAYLERHGWKILGRKVRYRVGELDIVAAKADLLAFVEVKNYSESSYHDALDALTPVKIKKIIAAARHFLFENDVAESVQIRFDVVTIDRSRAGAVAINHIEDAFEWDR